MDNNITKFQLITIHLVEVPLLLVKVGSQSIGSLHINHEILHFTLESLFGLLQRGTLGIHSLYLFLSLLKTLGKLFPVKEQPSLLLSPFIKQNVYISLSIK